MVHSWLPYSDVSAIDTGMRTTVAPTPERIITGTAFIESIKGMSIPERENVAVCTVLAGHVPLCMRTFVDVTSVFVDNAGKQHTIVIGVLPDYLCVGDDSDRVRMPLTPGAAQKVADAWDCMLPTTKIARLVWEAAGVRGRLAPQPWGPPYDGSMMSTERISVHNSRINESARASGVDVSCLMAGHKKDVVVTPLLAARPKSVAIFGWFKLDGRPIQQLYLGHESTYVDYSHGARMVSRECVLDGEHVDIGSVLRNVELCRGLSDEGPMQSVRQPC